MAANAEALSEAGLEPDLSGGCGKHTGHTRTSSSCLVRGRHGVERSSVSAMSYESAVSVITAGSAPGVDGPGRLGWRRW